MDAKFRSELSAATTVDHLADALEYRLREMGFAGFAYWTHVKRPVDELPRGASFYLSRGPRT